MNKLFEDSQLKQRQRCFFF